MQTILITGIKGFLGARLANFLSAEYNIIGLTSNIVSSGNDRTFRLYAYDKNGLEPIFKEQQVDIIINTATRYKCKDSVTELIDSNILMPLELFELAEKYEVKAFLNTDTFFNSPGNNYSYLSEYTLSKRHLLEWLKGRTKKAKLVNMKLFHVYGPGDSKDKFVTQIADALKSNIPFIDLTTGEQKRDFIFIDDVVNAYNVVIKNLNKLNSGFTEFEIGTGNPISVREFICTLKDKLNAVTELRFGALKYRDNEIMYSCADNSKILELGWIQKYNISDGCSNI